MTEFEPSKQIVIAVSWRFGAELIRRHPRRLTLVEADPTGIYDCLTVVDRANEKAFDYICMNRPGHIHIVFGEAKHGKGGPELTWTDILAARDPGMPLDRLCEQANLPPVQHRPAGSPESLTYRVIAAFLQQVMFERTSWDCRNGYAGDMYGTVRTDWFDLFPGLSGRLAVREREDVLGMPETRFWFLLKDGTPVLAFEATHGTARDTTGKQTHLFAEYQLHHKLWPVVLASTGHLLP